MSFSGEVKKELMSVMSRDRACQKSELAAMLLLSLSAENPALTEKFFTLLRKAFNIDIVAKTEAEYQRKKRSVNADELIYHLFGGAVISEEKTPELFENEKCRRAFLRGAFLTAGSISTPEKYYHLEIVCQNEASASLIRQVMQRLHHDAKIVQRKNDFVVYLKEGEQIVTMLGEMGASISFLNLESIRVMKGMRESVNRKVNCETANLNKTIISAVRQMEDIRFLESRGILRGLKAPLRQMAEVRLLYPEAPLGQLGQYLNPPIGKSGVNHRLKKLSEIAAAVREGTEFVL